MLPFEFATTARIIVGDGTASRCGDLARAFGRRALVVHGRQPERAAGLVAALESAGLCVETFAVAHEPDRPTIERGVSVARAHAPDVVVGIGGGSAMDAAKAIAILAANDGDLLDYLEVVGRGQPFARPALPSMAIPTTAGTGSEVTRNAVIGSAEHRVKVSLRSASMLPRIAIVDPRLTRDVPPAITAATGLDALTQLIEPFVSCRANPLVDALAADGIRRAARALPRAVADGDDMSARGDMALASLYGGLALANAGLGAVHGLAGPIGGMFDAPHGAICAALLPHVFRANARAVRARETPDGVLERFTAVARLVTGRPTATDADGANWLADLVRECHVPGLGAYGITASDAASIADKAQAASSMKANPVALTPDELMGIVEAAL
jgi:alcohol dehydrogenase class IV